MKSARTWIPRGLATLVFCVYAWAAPAGLYWLDSAELTAAAATLGSPHPTGFPLYCMLGQLATLVPVGEIGYRVALLGAGCAALAVYLCARLAFELSREDLPGLVGATTAGALLAAATIFARQATVAQVHAPTAALMAGALLLLSRVARGADARHGLALAVLMGLGLGAHITFLVLAPPTLALFIVRLYRGARWPLAAPLLMVLVAAALYTYLPLRSASGHIPDTDWGQPRTASALWDHATAAGFRPGLDELGGARPDGSLLSLVETTAESVGPIALMAAGFGFFWLFRQRRGRWLAATLGAMIVGNGAYCLWAGPAGAAGWRDTVPLTMAVCVTSGVAVAWFARYLGRPGPYVGAVVGLVLVLMPALGTVSTLEPASVGQMPRAWAEAGMLDAPPDAVVLATRESTVAGMIYLHAVEGVRPDLTIFDRRRLDADGRVAAYLARLDQARGAGGADEAVGMRSDEALGLLIERAPAIVWEPGRDLPPRGTALLADAPLARLLRTPDEERSARAAMAADLALAPDDAPGPEGDPMAAAAPSDIHRAVEALRALFDRPGGDDPLAVRAHAQALTALGRLVRARGDLELAALVAQAATEIRPEHASAWALAALVANERGQPERARAWLERARFLDATDPEVRALTRSLHAPLPDAP